MDKGRIDCDGQAGGVAQIYHPDDVEAITQIGILC